MARLSGRPPWREGNRIDLLQNGQAYFPALCQAIDQAGQYVHLETYIFNLDATGLKVLAHLEQACQRGIKVRVVLDGFGSVDHLPAIRNRLDAMGAQLRVHRPEPTGWRRYRFQAQRLRRLHRKMVVIDGYTGFVGGINVLDDFVDVPVDDGKRSPRFDFAVRIQGPLVQDLVRAQDELWVRLGQRGPVAWQTWYQRVRQWAGWRARRLASLLPHFEGGVRARLLLRDNVRYRKTIEDAYVRALALAKQDAIVANSYFFPGRRLRQALKLAARRGVRVRLLLQGRSEYPIQHWASRNLYGPLLKSGIEVYEYMPSYLHAKVAVMDGLAMVGSSNMDPFSLLLAREANVLVDDQDFTVHLQSRLEHEMAENCRQLTLDGLRQATLLTRCLDALAYRVLRIAVALTGKGSEY